MSASTSDIVKDTINEFEIIQNCMLFAREENAQKTYNELKRRYLSLKAILQSNSVSLTSIDKINEE